MNERSAQLYAVNSLGFLGLHPPVSCLPSPQLTLPEDTQPRQGHTLTSCRMGESRIHATTFGGSPSYDPYRSVDDDPKLADTMVLEFGEQSTHHLYHVLGCVFTDNKAIDLNWHALESNWLSNSVSSLPSPGIYAQLLTCNLHCYSVYWLCTRGWLIQLLHHFISLISRPFSCPTLIACSVTDWMAWKNLQYISCPLLVAKGFFGACIA